MIGGPAFSIMPEEILDYLGGDYGVVGEAEHIICGIIDALSKNKPVRRITRNGSHDEALGTTALGPLLGARPGKILRGAKRYGEHVDKTGLPTYTASTAPIRPLKAVRSGTDRPVMLPTTLSSYKVPTG